MIRRPHPRAEAWNLPSEPVLAVGARRGARSGRPPTEEGRMMTFTLVALVGVAFVAGVALASMIANTDYDLAEVWQEGREAGYVEGRAAIAGPGYTPNPPRNPYERTDQ